MTYIVPILYTTKHGRSIIEDETKYGTSWIHVIRGNKDVNGTANDLLKKYQEEGMAGGFFQRHNSRNEVRS
jgi:hypothetical protein